MSVKWDEPIEAVHEDGRVVAASACYQRADKNWNVAWISHGLHCSGSFDDEGEPIASWPWRIRNVAQAPQTPHPAPSPSEVGSEVIERMIALVRRVAGSESFWVEETEAEARAIVALLPEPVDAMEQAFRAECHCAGDYPPQTHVVTVEAFKRAVSRALEKEAGR